VVRSQWLEIVVSITTDYGPRTRSVGTLRAFCVCSPEGPYAPDAGLPLRSGMRYCNASHARAVTETSSTRDTRRESVAALPARGRERLRRLVDRREAHPAISALATC